MEQERVKMQLDFEDIKKLIPQRFPFIMIDKVVAVVPGKEAETVKNISGNDIFFLGHFPDKAILPGVAIIEAMAQTAIILFAAGKEESLPNGAYVAAEAFVEDKKVSEAELVFIVRNE
jgi:3-hydroxyacyl-[acyl-carrier-protein] dehydratase